MEILKKGMEMKNKIHYLYILLLSTLSTNLYAGSCDLTGALQTVTSIHIDSTNVVIGISPGLSGGTGTMDCTNLNAVTFNINTATGLFPLFTAAMVAGKKVQLLYCGNACVAEPYRGGSSTVAVITSVKMFP